jgi:hypothetical protein
MLKVLYNYERVLRNLDVGPVNSPDCRLVRESNVTIGLKLSRQRFVVNLAIMVVIVIVLLSN